MTQQIINFSNMPNSETKLIRESGVHRIKTRYSKDNMVDRWDSFLSSHVTDSYSWYDYRWGYTRQTVEELSWATLGKTIRSVTESSRSGGKVLILGSFDGKQVDIFLRVGLDVTGIEPDSQACEMMSEQAKSCVENVPFNSKWPSASMAVVTDYFDLIEEEGSLEVVAEKLATHEWVFVRLGSSSKWGTPSLDSVRVENLLESVGLSRRADLENMAKESGDLLTHQIWQKGADTSFMPAGILGERINDNHDSESEPERGGMSGASEVTSQRPARLERVSKT